MSKPTVKSFQKRIDRAIRSANSQELMDAADDLLDYAEELEARDVVTPEYLDNWIERANTAEQQLKSICNESD